MTPGTQEARAGRLLQFLGLPELHSQSVQGHPGLQCEILSQKITQYPLLKPLSIRALLAH